MNNRIIQTAQMLAFAFIGALTTQAESFDFKDPKGINNITFTIDAPLEYISGTANGISGTVEFDPAHPENTSGTITLETHTLMVANSMMRDHILGDQWMEVEKYPTITFVTTNLEGVESDGNTVKAIATGTLTIKETTKEIAVPITLTYLPGKLADRTNGNMQGDLLVLRTSFSISRSEFGINAGNNEDKVSNDILLKLSIAGAAVK